MARTRARSSSKAGRNTGDEGAPQADLYHGDTKGAGTENRLKKAGEAEDEAEKGARGRTQDNGTHNNWYGHEGDFKTGGLDIADRGDRHEYLNGEEYGYFYVVEGLFIDTFFSHYRAPFLS